MQQFEQLLSSNKHNHTSDATELYFVGSKFNCADIMAFDMLELSLRLDANALNATPMLQKFHAQIAKREKIAKYLASGKRPEKINNSGKG